MEKFRFYLITHKNLSHSTAESYINDIKLYYQVHNTLSIETIQQYLDKIDISARSKARKISAFKVYIQFYNQDQNCKLDASLLNTYKYNHNLPQHLSKEDIDKILAIMQKHNSKLYIIVELIFATGLRISEILSIKISDISNTERTEIKDYFFIKTKGKKEKAVIIPHKHHKALIEHINKNKHHKYLFEHKGRPLSRQAVYQALKRIESICEAGSLYPHIFRHSFATHLLSRKVNIRIIQELLGHSDLNTTQIYTHIENSHIEQILEKYNPLNQK